MKETYIQSIHVNKLFHLHDFDIRIGDEGQAKKHLIITGSNGTGKTLLLNAIADSLENIATDKALRFMTCRRDLQFCEQQLEMAVSQNDAQKTEQKKRGLERLQAEIGKLFGKVELGINNLELLPRAVSERRFVIAYYGDQRRSEFKEVRNPEKPNLDYKDIKTNKVGEFIKFLVDLKVQRALAEGENAKEYAQEIERWFDNLEGILRRLFCDDKLMLEFDFKTYSFFIHSQGKVFRFTELSAGYSAALDIVADLILKMQERDRLTLSFNAPGIILIDEIDTHLHLKMQKEILRFITTLFPNIQLIITTHSPFVLSSLPDAVAYDLEHREPITDLTNYSYDALAEGYFEVDMESGRLSTAIEKIEQLADKEKLTVIERNDLKNLIHDFDNIPDAVAPTIKARYYAAIVKMDSSKLNDR